MNEPEQYAPGPANVARVQKTGREKVDAHSRPGVAPLAGKSLGGADRSGAVAGMGSLRDRCELGRGWNGAAYLGGGAHADRNKRDARRSSQGA